MRRQLESGAISISDIATGGFKQIDFRSSIFDLVHNIRNSFRPSSFAMSSGAAARLGVPTTIEAAGKRKLSAVEVLVQRLIWYPVVLVIVEIFRDLDRQGAKDDYPLHLMHLLTNSLQGTAYFIIFLTMQPKAYSIFISFFTCVYVRQNIEASLNPQPPLRSMQVSWANSDDKSSINQLKTDLVNDEMRESKMRESLLIMNELDEDDLVEQVEVNNNFIQDVIRNSMTDMTRGSSTIQPINVIRIADTTDINL